jgi:hypothetical protein
VTGASGPERDAHFGTSLDAPVGSDPDGAPLVEAIGSEDDRLLLADTALDLCAGIRRLAYLERRALSLRFGDWRERTRPRRTRPG